MNISINEQILDKYHLTLEEFLVLFLCSRDCDIEATIKSLILMGIVDKDLRNPLSAVVSDNTKEIVASIIIDSDSKVIDKDEEFSALADKMRDLYPDGKKPGSTYYWKDSVPIIARKLKTLVAKFGVQLTEEKVLSATRRYIESFNGNYTYMQLLKYFILKTDKTTGDIRSELLSYMENEGQDTHNDNWLTDVR